jgi:hypothetical protein
MPMQHDQPVLLEQPERFSDRHLAQREVARQLGQPQPISERVDAVENAALQLS